MPARTCRKIHELESCLSQTRVTCKVSLDTVSSQLSEKCHEVESCRMELEKFKALIASVESQHRTTESGRLDRVRQTHARVGQHLHCIEWQTEVLWSCYNGVIMVQISSLESELSQLNGSVSHYQGLTAEYKVQLERHRAEQESLGKELRLREQEVDQLKRENLLEAEKVHACVLQVAKL